MRGNPSRAPRIYSYLDCKLPKIPEDFTLIIDTREQSPLFVGRIPKGLNIQSGTLKHGDYSIKGLEDKVCIERKQISDFLSYIGTERKHTKSKLDAMSNMTYKALVLECSQVFEIPSFSRLTPEHLRGFFISAEVRYGLHVLIHPDRRYIERWVLDRLIKVYNLLREV